MFTQTWKKYLPVIKLFLKRSLKEEQSLSLNSSDFQKAAGGKKIKYNFSVTLVRGRIERADNTAPIARQLAEVLFQDEQSFAFLQKQVIEFNMKSGFQLGIKNVTPVPLAVAEEEVTAEPDDITEEEVKTEESVNKS
jgi:hypothetical protein